MPLQRAAAMQVCATAAAAASAAIASASSGAAAAGAAAAAESLAVAAGAPSAVSYFVLHVLGCMLSKRNSQYMIAAEGRKGKSD